MDTGHDYKEIIQVPDMKALDKARYEELVKNASGISLMKGKFFDQNQLLCAKKQKN